ncbi:SNO glutamine amidotransferase family, partial [Rhizoctonia solani]
MAIAETERPVTGVATVGVLANHNVRLASIYPTALQGAFAEHHEIISRVTPRVQATLVRTPAELALCDGLIIPGGESTSIILLARLANLLEPLREFIRTKPVWGTCAGAILLASGGVEGAKRGGQEVLGGVDIRIGRNGFGSQLESFEAELEINGLADEGRPFNGIFIRAPIILSFTEPDPKRPIEHIARLPGYLLPDNLPYTGPSVAASGDLSVDPRTVVALRQGRTLLTTFHPELTRDDRFHEYFVRNCVLGLSPSAAKAF